MDGASLSAYTLLAALVVGGLAIDRLSVRSGHGWAWRLSGVFAAAAGLLVFFNAPSVLPISKIRFAEPLAFGVAYLGQASLCLWLAMKAWPHSSECNGASQ